MRDFISIVKNRWDEVMTLPGEKPASGSNASVRFQLNSNGDIQRIIRIEGTAGTYGYNAAVIAIQTPAPYPPWSPTMIAALGQTQILTFDFLYQ